MAADSHDQRHPSSAVEAQPAAGMPYQGSEDQASPSLAAALAAARHRSTGNGPVARAMDAVGSTMWATPGTDPHAAQAPCRRAVAGHGAGLRGV